MWFFQRFVYPGLWELAKNEVCNHFENSCTLVYGNWSNMKFVNFSKNHVPGSMKIGKKWILIFLKKFTYPGLWKLVKNEVCEFFKNSCTWGYENWPKINFDILLEIQNWLKMKFVIFSKIHVPGSMKIGKKWTLIFSKKITYPGLWKLAKIEVWYFHRPG